MNGTSFSSPVVAGVAAVIRSYYPELTAPEVKDILMRSVIKVDDQVKLPSKPASGNLISFSKLSLSGGVVNLYDAIKLADELTKEKNAQK